ncbi:fibronectin type III-like domain-contianing protein [Bacillus sp. USDA818B3_A]|uniref:fibronectin type III-like domain-contianing protein n=1 Tax=Bacillus sp. USDA818B3_A TaxID=2698834 RepID=UPI001922B0AD|nr:fibronectin type III-like domain-contianing protein [Bacillus sp. USDA818B3_A]
MYPFGFGLIYTSFNYENLVVNSKEITKDSLVTISIDISNTGQRAGDEVVQLYISDVVASRVRPVKELKGFKKINLQPKERQTVTFEIDINSLGFYNEVMEYIVEPGLFKVFIGSNSQEGLEGEFRVLEK